MTRAEKVEVAVGALATREVGGRVEVLLIRRGNPPAAGLWTLPGGRVHVGETLAAAVAREVEEETGLRVTGVGPRIDVVERIGSMTHHVIVEFRVRVDDEGLPVAGDDAADATWAGRGEVEALDTTRGLPEFLARHAWADRVPGCRSDGEV